MFDLEVLQKGALVAKKIGNPITIGSDGKVGLLEILPWALWA